MNKILKIFLAMVLTVSMMLEIIPVNIIHADDEATVEETTEVAEAPAENEENETEEEAEVPELTEMEEDPLAVEEEDSAEEEFNAEAIEANEAAETEDFSEEESPAFVEQEGEYDGLKVNVSYDPNAFAETATLVVGEVGESEAAALKEAYGESYKAVDISFNNDEGDKIQPLDGYSVNVKLSSEDMDAGDYHVLHVDGEGNINEVEEIIDVATGEITTVEREVLVPEMVEVPVYEEQTKEVTVPAVIGTRTVEDTEEVTTPAVTGTRNVKKTRTVEKTRTVKVKVDFVWWNPSTWLGYKYVTEKYPVTETYYEKEEYVITPEYTDTVVVGSHEEEYVITPEHTETVTEQVQVGTTWKETGNTITEIRVVEVNDVEVSFAATSFSTYAIEVEQEESSEDLSNVSILKVSGLTSNTKAGTGIAATKKLTDNLDENGEPNGTQKLSLSVKGEAQSDTITQVTKTNVVVMIDLSGSMDDSITAQDIEYTYDASTYISGQTYRGRVNNEWRNLTWSTTNNRWQYTRYGTTYPYTGTVYWRVTNRLNATKAATYALIDALLENNTAEIPDIMEISVAKFANKTATGNYNGTQTLVSKSTVASTLKAAIRDMRHGGGTNWEAAYQECLAEANRVHVDGENTVVIFVTDGKPTLYGNDSGTGREGDSNVQTSWNAADEDAAAIVEAGYDLYNIFAFGTSSGTGSGADYLKAMTNHAYRGTGTYSDTDDYTYEDGTKTSDHFFDANSTEALIEALKAIIDKINQKVGFAGVDFVDGVTLGVTNTSVVVDGEVHDESFDYTVTDKNNVEVYKVKISNGVATFTIGDQIETDSTPETVVTKIDPDDESTWITSTVYSVTVGEGENAKTYSMSPAKINKTTGLIDWDLAGLGILEDGYTYTLSFDVWPNQFSYDMMADLNNGVKTLEEVEAEVGADAWDKIANAIVVTFNGQTKPISELTADEKAKIDDGTYKCQYAILTNWKQEVTYYTADEEKDEDGNVIGITYSEKTTYNPIQPDAVALTSSTMMLRKLWEADLDSSQVQRLLYNTDGTSKKYKVDLKVWKADTKAELDSLVEADGNNYYKQVTLGWDDTNSEYVWGQEMDVAPGIMVDEDLFEEMGLDPQNYTSVTYNGVLYYVLESGHYYYVTEVQHDYHFDLVTIVYHPMLVNGKLSNVTFKDDGTVEDIDPMSTVDAANTLRGGINLDKVVLASNGEEYPTDDPFTFSLVLDNEKEGMFVEDDIPWYSFNGYYYHTADGEYTDDSSQLPNVPEVTNSGKTATYSFVITSADAVRIVNVPVGTEFTVTETQNEGFELESVIVDIGAYVPVYDDDGNYQYDDEGNIITEWESEQKESYDTLTVTGEIFADAENNITYRNKMVSDPVFYVYHSSNGRVEKISAFDERVERKIDSETNLMTLTFNLAEETLENHLYGGYYEEYPGVVATDAQITGTAETGNLEYEVDETGIKKAYVEQAHTGGYWATDEDAKVYDYAYIAKVREGDAEYADWGSKYYTEKGTEMHPEADTVYYLKEVPNQYDLPYTHYTYGKNDKVLRNMWYITAIDDLKYSEVGFIVVVEDKETGELVEKVVQTLTVTSATNNATVKLTPKSVFGGGGNKLVEAGYLGYKEFTDLIVANTSSVFTPYWKTMDGVTVRGTQTRTINFNNGKVGSGGMRITNANTKLELLLADITNEGN